MTDWTLLRSFLAVAETGSLSAAAERLHLTQPTVGRHIRALEEEIGRPLFRRLPRGLEPTEGALPLVEEARRMAEAADAFARKAAGGDGGLSGTVRLTASRVISTYLLPSIVAALRLEAPDVDLEIVASDRSENLHRRDADVALRLYEPRQVQLVRRKICDIPLAVYATPAYLARKGTPKTLTDLLDHEFIGLDRVDDYLRGFEAFGYPVRREWFPIRCDDYVVDWELTVAGAGIGFGQRPIGDADRRVVRVDIEGFAFTMPLWIAYHEDLRTSPRIRFVVDRLAAELAVLIARGRR
jgi:DNA-binding transcriptional LysR family regulator